MISHDIAKNTSDRVLLGRLNDLQGEGPFPLSAGGGVDLVVVRTESGLKAYQGRCPHQGALLGEGEMDGDSLVCRNHRWRFDTVTGARRGGPQCLISCPLEVRDHEIWADVSQLQQLQLGNGPAARRTPEQLPGPKGLPLLGNIHQIDRLRLHEVLERWAAQYGSPFTYRMGPKRVIGIADAELSEKILRDRPETWRRTSVVETVFQEMGVAGVFSAEGEAWRPQRRLAMEALAHRNLKAFYPALQTVARRLRERWQQKAQSGEVLNLVDEMKRFTVDITTVLVFGHDLNTLDQGEDVIQRQLELVFPAFNRRLFAILPTWRWVRMPADHRLDRALAELREWLGIRLDEARARLAADPARAEHPEHFIESMLVARDQDGRPFSDDVIYGNAMTMLLAGEDTTAFTLAWAVHELCDAPEVVAALRAESDALLSGGVAEDIETANRLTYAGAVANETMRLRPVAPLFFLEATRDVVIDDVAVPGGTWVVLLTRPPVVDERNFEAAVDFRPERWLESRSAGTAHEAGAHIPFGTGPRICPGRSLALLEMKVALSMLYANFDIERVGRTDAVTELFDFTMAPVGLKVRVSPRS